MFKITNLAEFQRGLRDWLKEAEQTAITAYRGIAAYAFSYVAEEMPEYTGESVSNWRFSVGTPKYSSNSGIKDRRVAAGKNFRGLPVYQKQGFTAGDVGGEPSGQGGNPEALQIALGSLREGYQAVTSLDQVIFITNATEFRNGTKTVADLEEGGGWLRQVNQPGQMIGRAVSYITESFATINASNLKRLMVMPA